MSEPQQKCVKTTVRRPRNMETRGSSSAAGGRNAARRDPYYSPNLQASRLAKFHGRNLAYVRYADVSWLVEQGFLFPHKLEVHGTNTFVGLNGKLYPSLIRVFYYNFQYKDEVYMTLVQGNSGSPLGNCENEQWESFDVVEMYKSCFCGPHYFVLGELTKPGSLTFESRLLHYVIAYILVQRKTNHAHPTINDLNLLFAIWEGLLVNWSTEILKVMFGIASSSSRLLAYKIFISRIIDHMEIDTYDVEFQLTNTRDHLENPATVPEQHPDANHAEASQAHQAPLFGLAHLDVTEQRLKNRFDVGFQAMNDRIDSRLMSLYDKVAAGIQIETKHTKNEIDRIAFIMQTMSSFSHPPPPTDKP
ncbi:hypothetical protein Lal_00034003, partial [Lupinus albus]